VGWSGAAAVCSAEAATVCSAGAAAVCSAGAAAVCSAGAAVCSAGAAAVGCAGAAAVGFAGVELGEDVIGAGISAGSVFRFDQIFHGTVETASVAHKSLGVARCPMGRLGGYKIYRSIFSCDRNCVFQVSDNKCP